MDQSIKTVSFYTGFPKTWSLSGHLVDDDKAIFQAGEEEKAWEWLGEKTKWIQVVNPTPSFLERKLPETQVQVILDQLPSTSLIPHLQGLRVNVPSLAFAISLKKQGIQANVVPPRIPQSKSQLSSDKSFRRRLSISQDWLLWVDQRLISLKQRRSVLYAVLRLLQEHRHFHVAWVASKKIYTHPHFHVISPQLADQEEGWREANFFLLIGEPMQSMVLPQFRLIEAGVVPISSDVGDHDEWVKHFFSGIILRRKGIMRELSHYMSIMQKNTKIYAQLQQNGRRLIKKWVEQNE